MIQCTWNLPTCPDSQTDEEYPLASIVGMAAAHLSGASSILRNSMHGHTLISESATQLDFRSSNLEAKYLRIITGAEEIGEEWNEFCASLSNHVVLEVASNLGTVELESVRHLDRQDVASVLQGKRTPRDKIIALTNAGYSKKEALLVLVKICLDPNLSGRKSQSLN